MNRTRVESPLLAARYTGVGTITNTTDATSVDWSAAAVYKMASALTGNIEFDFTNYVAGQVLTIYNLSLIHISEPTRPY